ncbi:MAG TPA: hypothetical protein VF610_02825, partial [Segetibacter sp.]
HSKTCEAVLETSGWSPVAITKPRGLSFALQLNKLVNIKVTYIVSILIRKIEGIKDVYTR